MIQDSPTAILLDTVAAAAAAAGEPETREAARWRLLDWMGCALAGARLEGGRVARMLDLSGETAGPAAVVGLGRRASAGTAALANGMLAHAAEMDDGNRFGMVHPGAPVIAALAALSAVRPLTEDDLIRGLVAGYEAAIRLAQAVQPEAKTAGLHATGICGAPGAAMAAAVALGLDRPAQAAALAAAATGSAGLLRVIRGGSDLKPLNAGQAARTGLTAALLAAAGFDGPGEVLGGSLGWLEAMRAPGPERAAALQARPRPAIHEVYLKPYASCRHSHAPVEAALRLRAAGGLPAEAIAAVEVATHRLAIYQHDHTEIDGPQSARMGIPYCVAAALVAGEAGMAAFDPAQLADPATLRVMRATRVVEDPAMTEAVPQVRPARVTVRLDSGEVRACTVDLPRGEPETALTPAEQRAKFLDLAAFGGLTPDRAAALADRVLGGDGLGALRDPG